MHRITAVSSKMNNHQTCSVTENLTQQWRIPDMKMVNKVYCSQRTETRYVNARINVTVHPETEENDFLYPWFRTS